MKLCVNCQHYKRKLYVAGSFPLPPSTIWDECHGDPVRSLIDGSIVVRDARVERRTNGAAHCAKIGRWFTPRKPTPPEMRILREGETPCPDCGGGVANLHINCRSGPRISSKPKTLWQRLRTLGKR